jgi:hypothetical protein
VRALVNRAFGTTYKLKRIRRVLELAGWQLPHSARIACWNGEYAQVGLALDRHDREVLALVAVPRDLIARDIQQRIPQAVATRFGTARLLTKWTITAILYTWFISGPG